MDSPASSTLPAQAKCVVIGAGIVGNSLLGHLAHLGWKDLVLIDKGPLPNPGGSTGHASNFIFPVDHSREMTDLTADSLRQYEELGVLTVCGGIEVARTEERMEELRRRMASAKAFGVDGCSLVTPAEIKELVPYVDESILLGGFYSKSVGVVDSLRAGTLMREEAQSAAALTVSANTEVLGIDTEGGRVKRVRTDRGDIETAYVVIACGVWSPRLAQMAGASIPLTPAVHQMIDVGPVPRFEQSKSAIEFPIVRDMDTNMYERQDGSGLEVGSYAHRPILHDPDGLPILGETSEVRGLWSAAAVWVKEGPGVGRAVAEWMVLGEPEIDLQASDIARFYEHQKTVAHVKARAAEGFNKTYGIVHPGEQWASNRDVRLSPFHARERELGAVFYEAVGWERPHWYESNAGLVEEYGDRVTRREHEWDARWWSPIVNAEHLALRDRVGIVDLTAFSIFDVTGPGAVEYLQGVAVRQMDVPVGRVVYTPLLNAAGGIKSDLTIMRLAADEFRVVPGGATGRLDRKW